MAPKKKTAPAKEAEGAVEATATPAVATPAAAENALLPAAQLYAKVQEFVSQDAAALGEHVQEVEELLQYCESADTPLHVRVRLLDLFGQHAQHLREKKLTSKALKSLANIIAGTDDTPQLITAAIRGIAALGLVPVPNSQETFAFQSADILMVLILDESFPKTVRDVAGAAVEHLTTSCFRDVVKKLLHWISDQRATAGEEAQVEQERQFAINRLTRLVRTPAMREKWTEELQTLVLDLLSDILLNVGARDFYRLVQMAAQLPMCREKQGRPLLECFLKKNKKLDSERAWESLTSIGRYLDAALEVDLTPYVDTGKVLKLSPEDVQPASVWSSRVLLLAVRHATPEAMEFLFPIVMANLAAFIGDGSCIPQELSIFEAVLLSSVAVVRTKATEMVQQLSDEKFHAAVAALRAVLHDVDVQTRFAVKKLVMQSKAQLEEAETLNSLTNLIAVLTAFEGKRLPATTIVPSWLQKRVLPKVHHPRPAGAKPSAGGSGKKRQRTVSAGAPASGGRNGATAARRFR